MFTQKFRIGDLVKLDGGNTIHRVTGVVHTRVKTEEMEGENWTYQLQGTNGRLIPQDSLKSATCCPSCSVIDWNWVDGCGAYGLKPDGGDV